MRDSRELISDIVDTEELIEEIDSLEKTLKDKLIEIVKDEMDCARVRYYEGGADYAERIEFADYYFELDDILKELYWIDGDTFNECRVNELVSLKLKFERAYLDLRQNVNLYDSLDNEQLELF